VSHVLLANNDLTFSDPTLPDRLLQRATEGAAAVGPVIRSGDGSIASAGVQIGRWTAHARRLLQLRSASPYAVDALDGSCLLVSLDAMCHIGAFEPEFFLYWEETDWCRRARAHGYQLLIDPTVSVTHAGGASGDLRTTRRYALRNSLLFVRRNVRGVRGLVAAASWLLARVPIFLARRLGERASPGSVVADAWWAISWHVEDVRRRGWHRAPEGPRLCE
jgi:GT2 family glycosyltransferase